MSSDLEEHDETNRSFEFPTTRKFDHPRNSQREYLRSDALSPGMPTVDADGFPTTEAKLVAIFVQSILYGIFSALFVGSMVVLRKTTGKWSGLHRVMIWTAILMWIVATTHIGVNCSRIIEAFVIHADDEGGPAAYFNRLSNFTNLFGSALYLFQTLLGDTFLLYRSAIVWNYDWRVVAFPSVLLLGSIASAIGTLYHFAKTSDGVVFLDYLGSWIISFFALTLATNLICTSLLVIKIWTMNRCTTHIVGGSLTPVLLVVLESGAIYPATLISLLICYLAGSWSQYVLVDAVSPIVGIVFSLVFFRLGLHLSRPDGTILKFRDTSTRSTLWDSQPRNSQDTKLHVVTAHPTDSPRYHISRGGLGTEDD